MRGFLLYLWCGCFARFCGGRDAMRASTPTKDTGRGECRSPRRCAAYRVLRIATPACGLVRNDKFGKCGAHRFAMTVFESTAGVVGASRTPPPTECGAGGRGRTPPLCGTWRCGALERLFSTFCKKIKNFSTMLLPFVQHRRRDLPIYRINFGKGELSL